MASSDAAEVSALDHNWMDWTAVEPQKIFPQMPWKGTGWSREEFRSNVDACVRQRLVGDLAKKFSWATGYITFLYTNVDYDINLFEDALHDIWYLLIETAKIAPPDTNASVWLVHKVIAARELGMLRRAGGSLDAEVQGNDGQTRKYCYVETAWLTGTLKERIWTDLPFLAEDLEAAWLISIDKESSAEMENLATLTARLIGLGVRTQSLTPLAIMVFKSALEQSRYILAKQFLAHPALQDHPVVHFLPAMERWMKYGAFNILKYSCRDRDSTDQAIAQKPWAASGQLYINKEKQHVPGLSMSRWRFWRTRLLECQKQAAVKMVAERFHSLVTRMDGWAETVGSLRNDNAPTVFFNGRLSIEP